MAEISKRAAFSKRAFNIPVSVFERVQYISSISGLTYGQVITVAVRMLDEDKAISLGAVCGKLLPTTEWRIKR